MCCANFLTSATICVKLTREGRLFWEGRGGGFSMCCVYKGDEELISNKYSCILSNLYLCYIFYTNKSA